MRTQAEIEIQIEGLKKVKSSLPSHSAFGDDNWGQIDAQLDILERKKELEDFEEDEYDEGSYDEDIYFAAMGAKHWLDGDLDEDLFEE